MTIPQNVTSLLESSGVRYEILKHPQAFTAQEVAATVHVTGKEVAKTLVVDADGKYVMAVIPAPHKLSLKSLKDVLAAKEVRLASEAELTQLFPDCEVGAMPPFGNLYGIPVYVDTELAKDERSLYSMTAWSLKFINLKRETMGPSGISRERTVKAFDLAKDPWETTNLAPSVSWLAMRIACWLKSLPQTSRSGR